MSKILLIEDDEALALGIEFTLEEEGYEVKRAANFKEGESFFYKRTYDLILLDINLPDGSGYALCKKIREQSNIPIIFLTALDDEVNIVLGLDIGGDDYITKPFRVKELLSRIKASLRRNSKNSCSLKVIKSGALEVDSARAIVKKNNEIINLTAQEYKLLLIFMNKPKTLMKRNEILKQLTEGEEAYFGENTLSVYIKRIREKIEDNYKEPEYIINQRGLGYIWNKDVVED